MSGSGDALHPYTVIVIGSGCSVGLGIPTMFNFMDKVLERADTRPRPLPDPPNTEEPSDLLRIQSFIKALRSSSAYVKNRLLNIEEIYGLADMQSEELMTDDEKERIEGCAVKRALNRTIYEIAKGAGNDLLDPNRLHRYPLANLQEIKRESQAQQPLHREFGNTYRTLLGYLCLADYVDLLPDRRRLHPLFIQFNWDLALDRALFRWCQNEAKRVKSFSASVRGLQLPWYPDSDEGALGKTHYLGNYAYLPQVARPHGAINWLQLEEKHTVPGVGYRRLGDRRDKQDRTLQPGDVEVHVSSIETGEDVQNPERMAIVPPTWRKEANNHALAHQWSVMKQGLEEARQIVFVGYSLPKSDLYFRHFLSLALRNNDYLPRVYVWNPSILDTASPEHESYTDLFEPLAREGRLFGIAGRFGDPALFDLARTMSLATPLTLS